MAEYKNMIFSKASHSEWTKKKQKKKQSILSTSLSPGACLWKMKWPFWPQTSEKICLYSQWRSYLTPVEQSELIAWI